MAGSRTKMEWYIPRVCRLQTSYTYNGCCAKMRTVTIDFCCAKLRYPYSADARQLAILIGGLECPIFIWVVNKANFGVSESTLRRLAVKELFQKF